MNRTSYVKATLLAAVLALGVPGFVQAQQPAASAPPKIAVLDSQRVLRESVWGKEAQGKLDKLGAAKQQEIQKLEKDLQELEQKIKDQQKSLSEDALAKLNNEYSRKVIERDQAGKEAQQEFSRAVQKEQDGLSTRILPIIQTVGQEQGFLLILEKGSTIYSDKSVDITDRILEKVNTQVTVPAPAKAETGAAKPAATPAAAPKKK